jgi:adenylate cyclase class IV
MQNIEIKTRLADPGEMERRLAALGADPVWVRRQRDTFFCVPRGYLKLRTAAAVGPGPALPGELIAYSREPGAAPRASDYQIARFPAPEGMEGVLPRCLGTRGVVEKTRRLYLWKHTRIHLDTVEGLGSFLELETVIEGIRRDEAERETQEVIRALALDPAGFLDRPYLELLESERDAVTSPER